MDITDVLKSLIDQCDLENSYYGNLISVSRMHIFDCAKRAFKRRAFDPQRRLNVVFLDAGGVGEGAVDEGGPTREFCRLLVQAIQRSPIFEGPDNSRELAFDVAGKYFTYLLMRSAYVCVSHGSIF